MMIRRISRPSGTFLFLALILLLPFSTIMFSATDGFAEIRYVTPSAEVVVRTGQGTEYKIIDLVKDGDSVEIIEEGDSYTKVRLADGKEGWMLKRFLSVRPPLSAIVASLRDENEKTKQKDLEVSQKLDVVSATLSRTENELKTVLAERDRFKTDYQNLQRDTADVIKIKTDMEKATKENQLLVQQMASVKEENNKLNKDKSINWFMAGGGVLLVGIVLGRITSGSRKRKSTLI